MARQWAIVKLNRHGFMAIVLSSQNAMSLCHAVINLLSLTKDKEGKNSRSEKWHNSVSDTSLCMI